MSFAQEMKDFLSAYQTVSQMKEGKAKREADTAYNNAILELKQQEMALARDKFELDKMAQQRRAAIGGAGGGRAISPSEARAQQRFEWEKEDRERAASEREAASKAEEAYQALPVEEVDLEELPEFADGGLVPEQEEPKPAQAIPVEQPTAPAPAPAPAPARAQQPPAQTPDSAPASTPAPSPEATRVVVEASREAGEAVMKNIERKLNRPPQAVGGQSTPTDDIDFVAGNGGMTPQEIQQIERAIDPEGKIAPHLTTAATLSQAFRTFMDPDNPQPDKALRIAEGYLTGVKRMTQTLGALGMEAFRNGDVEAACRLLNDACNRFPSGHEIFVRPDARNGIAYEVKLDGKTVEQGKMNPAQFLEFSGSVANGQAFTQQMVTFVTENRSTRGDIGQAISGVEQAASRLAGIRAEIENTGGSDELLAAEKEALQALNASEQAARRLAQASTPRDQQTPNTTVNYENSIRAAKRAGLDMPMRYEPPAEAIPTGDDRNWWERNAPGFLGGEDPPAAQPAATPQGNPQGATTGAANGLAQPKTRAEFDALPRGARFVDPEGVVRIKP